MKLVIMLLFLISCSLPKIASVSEVMRAKELIEQARVKMMSKDLAQAESLVLLADELAPNEAIVLDAHGCLEWYRKNYDLAESYFRKAILINPTFDNSYLNLAIVLEHHGQIQQAQEMLERALKINPMNFKARNNYAGMILDYSQTDAQRDLARREFNKALNSAPEVDPVLKYNTRKFSTN